MYINDLTKKIDDLLYLSINPDIRSRSAIADALKVAKPTISSWENADSIPDIRVVPLCDLFLLTEADLMLPFAEFQGRLRELNRGWTNLLKTAEFSEAVRIEVCRQRGAELILESEAADIEQFRVGDKFSIELDQVADQSVIILMQDPYGLHCLFPFNSEVEMVVDDVGGLVVPGDGKYFRFTQPCGRHTLLAIVKKTRWGDRLYQHLQSERLIDHAVQHIDTVLRAADASEWQVVGKYFDVG